MGGGGGPDGGSRRSRNPVARKTVDCHASLVHHLQHRFYQPHNLPRPFLPPTVDSVPFLPALFPPPCPSWPPRFLADHFCTRYVHQSINKQRTAIHCCGFSPDNKRLVTGAASGELTLWNAQTFNFETILAAHDDAVRCMTWGGEASAAVLCTGDDSGVIKYCQQQQALTAHFVDGPQDADCSHVLSLICCVDRASKHAHTCKPHTPFVGIDKDPIGRNQLSERRASTSTVTHGQSPPSRVRLLCAGRLR